MMMMLCQVLFYDSRIRLAGFPSPTVQRAKQNVTNETGNGERTRDETIETLPASSKLNRLSSPEKFWSQVRNGTKVFRTSRRNAETNEKRQALRLLLKNIVSFACVLNFEKPSMIIL